MNASSIIRQLENDQLHEEQGDAIERAYRIGHNALTNAAIALLNLGDGRLMDLLLEFANEHDGDDEARAFARGRNAAVRNVRHVIDRNLTEMLASAMRGPLEILRALADRHDKEQEQRERAECAARDELARTNPVEFGLQELVENTPAGDR